MTDDRHAAPLIEPPRSAPSLAGLGRGQRPGEWLFVRVSGVLLVVLLLGHLYVMTIPDDGVQRLNFAFVAARWARPYWQLWDLLLLWLAMAHGALGLRTVIGDYCRRDGVRLLLVSVLYTASAAAIALGSIVILTFDPTR